MNSAQAFLGDEPRGVVSKSEHYRALRRIDELEADLAEARERLAWLLSDDDDDAIAAIRRRLRVSPGVARLLLRLYRAAPGIVRRDGDCASDSSARLMVVRVCLLRQALKRAGAPGPTCRGLADLPIATHHAIGYSLPPETIAWLKREIPVVFP